MFPPGSCHAARGTYVSTGVQGERPARLSVLAEMGQSLDRPQLGPGCLITIQGWAPPGQAQSLHPAASLRARSLHANESYPFWISVVAGPFARP